MPVMGHDPQAGQASDQANEVDRASIGPPPRWTDPRKGTPPGAKRFRSHTQAADQHQPCQPAPGQPPTTMTGDSVPHPFNSRECGTRHGLLPLSVMIPGGVLSPGLVVLADPHGPAMWMGLFVTWVPDADAVPPNRGERESEYVGTDRVRRP